jgi:hypothetical protein
MCNNATDACTGGGAGMCGPCGGLMQACCAMRTCTAAGTVCAGGGGGTCQTCGGAGQPCCAMRMCTAAGLTCQGMGNGGVGTCNMPAVMDAGVTPPPPADAAVGGG